MATERIKTMIKTENGNTTVNGNGLTLLADSTFVVYAIAESMKDAGIPAEYGTRVLSDLFEMAVEAGYSDDEGMDDILQREIDKMEAKRKGDKIDGLIDELFDAMLS